jgi:hypothetical protein
MSTSERASLKLHAGIAKQSRFRPQPADEPRQVAIVKRTLDLDLRRETLAHLSGEILPASEAVLTRDHDLRVALRERQLDLCEVKRRLCDGIGITGGDVARELLCLFSEGLERWASGEQLHCYLPRT